MRSLAADYAGAVFDSHYLSQALAEPLDGFGEAIRPGGFHYYDGVAVWRRDASHAHTPPEPMALCALMLALNRAEALSGGAGSSLADGISLAVIWNHHLRRRAQRLLVGGTGAGNRDPVLGFLSRHLRAIEGRCTA